MELEEINNEFVPHKESLLLKQIGFNAPCLFVYSEKGQRSPFKNFFVRNSNVPSYATGPTYRQVFLWFREKHNLDYSIYRPFTKVKQYCWNVCNREIRLEYPNSMIGEHAKTYEEAELACINKLIEIVMLQQKNATKSTED